MISDKPVSYTHLNDIDIEKRPFFIIITGANMAGKSTYLRTVGINYLLACIGTPVCARSMELYPVQLITSLRTSDSLNDNESYFFAELKRLKLIIDKLQAGEEDVYKRQVRRKHRKTPPFRPWQRKARRHQ